MRLSDNRGKVDTRLVRATQRNAVTRGRKRKARLVRRHNVCSIRQATECVAS
jgi:hypothetical protein